MPRASTKSKVPHQAATRLRGRISHTSSASREAVEALAANELFSRLPPPSKERLLRHARIEDRQRDEVVCHENSPAVRSWLLIAGEVKLVKYTTRGAALLIDIALPGEVFGAVFYEKKPVYPCTAIVLKPGRLLSFPLRDLIEELRGNPELQHAILADTCAKLCRAQQMREVLLENAPTRVAYLLLRLCGKFGPLIPETRSTLAELAGVSVETAIRITRDMARQGILTTRRGVIQVRSLAKLETCAHSVGQHLGQSMTRVIKT